MIFLMKIKRKNSIERFCGSTLFQMAERVGFEPTVPLRGTHDFQSCSFGLSDISPFPCLLIIIGFCDFCNNLQVICLAFFVTYGKALIKFCYFIWN